MDTEKAFIRPEQIPHMYTAVMYLLHSDLVVVHRKPLTTLAVTTQPKLQLSHRQQVPHSQGSYHTDSGSSTGLVFVETRSRQYEQASYVLHQLLKAPRYMYY